MVYNYSGTPLLLLLASYYGAAKAVDREFVYISSGGLAGGRAAGGRSLPKASQSLPKAFPKPPKPSQRLPKPSPEAPRGHFWPPEAPKAFPRGPQSLPRLVLAPRGPQRPPRGLQEAIFVAFPP